MLLNNNSVQEDIPISFIKIYFYFPPKITTSMIKYSVQSRENIIYFKEMISNNIVEVFTET